MFDDPHKLYFCFDYISHNAYLAWTKIGALAQAHGLKLQPVPVLFAGLLQAHGQRGPAEVLPKSRWMIWNVLRKAKLHGIPIAPPYSHPFNPLLPLRVSCADLRLEDQIRLVDCLYTATWAQGRAVHEEQTVTEVITQAGLDAQTVLAQARSEPVKARLRSNTEAALAAGVFGVPTLIVLNELFFGFDDLEHLERFLLGTDPLGDRAVYADWFKVRPSAQRKSA